MPGNSQDSRFKILLKHQKGQRPIIAGVHVYRSM